jgi:hypothetical protein
MCFLAGVASPFIAEGSSSYRTLQFSSVEISLLISEKVYSLLSVSLLEIVKRRSGWLAASVQEIFPTIVIFSLTRGNRYDVLPGETL